MTRGKGVWLPEELLLSDSAKDLTAAERILVALIHGLDNEYGCWASNEWLGRRAGIAVNSVARLIKKLEHDGWISVDGQGYVRIGGKQIRRRICHSLLGDRLESPIQNEKVSPIQNGMAVNNSPIQNGMQKKSKKKVQKDSKDIASGELFEASNDQEKKNQKSPYAQFVDLHFELHPTRPMFGKTEGAIVKRILKDQDVGVALEKLRAYYKADLWFTRNGQFSLKNFIAHYNEIPVNGAAVGVPKKRYLLSENSMEGIRAIFDNNRS